MSCHTLKKQVIDGKPLARHDNQSIVAEVTPIDNDLSCVPYQCCALQISMQLICEEKTASNHKMKHL